MYRSREAIVLLSATLLLIFQYYFVLAGEELLFFASVWVYFLIVPITLLFLFKASFEEFGFSWKTWPFGWVQSLIVGLALLAMTFVLSLPPQRDYYLAHLPTKSMSLLMIMQGLIYFAEEFFFRGFLLLQLRKKFGEFAIILQAVPFALFHMGKPPFEVVASLFVGLLFGHISYRTSSFLPTFLIHFAIGFLLRLLVVP